MNLSDEMFPSELTDKYLIRGYSIMGILSFVSAIFTLIVLLSRKGSKIYKFLTAQSLMNGYALGLFTLLGISSKWQFVGLLFSLVQMYSSAYICIIFRHQSILPFRSTLKLHTKVEYLLTFLAFDIGHSAMCISVALFIKNAEEDDSSPPWLLTRNSFVLPFHWSLFSIFVFIHIGGALSVTIGLVSFTFWHMIHTLKETRKSDSIQISLFYDSFDAETGSDCIGFAVFRANGNCHTSTGSPFYFYFPSTNGPKYYLLSNVPILCQFDVLFNRHYIIHSRLQTISLSLLFWSSFDFCRTVED